MLHPSSATASSRTCDDGGLDEAHVWEELAEYERGEIILQLLRRITDSCLRGDNLRVIEREEWVRSGSVSEDAVTCARHLLLFGHVRYRHRKALLTLIRHMRLHAVRDLGTLVTIGLQPGDAVPYVMLEPLSPSLQTDGFLRWNRVYYAMRCGILQKLHAREEKVRQRLCELIQETNAAPLPGPSYNTAASTAAVHPQLSPSAEAGANIAKRTETIRFYTEEFGQLFTSGGSAATVNGARGKTDESTKRFLPVSEYMAATKETRVPLTRVAATVPTILVAWSARYPECVEWLRQQLFHDAHLREIRNTTGLSGRFAVLMDKDPWVVFAEAHGGLLPRLPTQRKGFKIELLRPLPKRGQIVLLNMDEDAAAARVTLEKLRKRLDGWASPEVDLLSLWSGPEGLQSELAKLFNIQTLPFVVQTRPAHSTPQLDEKNSRNNSYPSAQLSSVPVIVDISCDPVKVSKRLYDVPDTPRSSSTSSAGGCAGGDLYWHSLVPAERSRVARRCGGYIAQLHLPLYFTAIVTRDYVLCNAAASNPWKAIEGTASSHVCILGDVVTTNDVNPILPELRLLAQLKDFEWGVRLMQRSAPLVSSLDPATPQRLLRDETRCVTCVNCARQLFVDTDVHVRCLHCTSLEGSVSNNGSNSGTFCETCAFTQRCHTPHHFLLRIPAGRWCPSMSLLWGPSNVAPLDLFMGRFVSNASDYHYGVYCDRCRSMIRGIRWKCAVCYQYDLCDACARERRGAVLMLEEKACSAATLQPSPPVAERTYDDDTVPAQHSDATHPMLFIPFSQGPHTDKFLQPSCVHSLKEWLDTVPQ